MRTQKDIAEEISQTRRKLIHSHFKYNKLGHIVSSMDALCVEDIQYARSVLDKFENGENTEDLIQELIKKQEDEETKYSNLMKKLENEYTNFKEI